MRQGIVYLQGEGWAAVATAAAVAGAPGPLPLAPAAGPAAHRHRPGPLAADLWHYGHGLVRSLPPRSTRGRRPVAGAAGDPAVRPGERRGRSPTSCRAGGTLLALAPVRALLDRMEPYSAVLWRIPYALNEDFDLMLTPWGSRSLNILHQDWDRSADHALRYLGAWNVGRVLLRKEAPAWAAEAEREPGRAR